MHPIRVWTGLDDAEALFPDLGDEGHSRAVGQMDVAGCLEDDEVGPPADLDRAEVGPVAGPGRHRQSRPGRLRWATSPSRGRPGQWPVAWTSSRPSRDCNRWPGPRSRRRPAGGGRRGRASGWRTRPGAAAWPRCREPARASMSPALRWVQWSALAAPSSTASWTPSPALSWLAWMRAPRPRSSPGGQDRPGLVGVEGPAFAEDVDPAGQRGAGGEHGSGDQLDVGGRVGLVGSVGAAAGDDVGAEEGRLLGELAGHRQAASLGVDVEAVAGLALERGHSGAQQLVGQPGHVGAQVVGRGGSGRGHGRANAAGRIGPTRHPSRELGRPVAGEDQVGMRVDEAGQHGATIHVHPLVGRGCPVGRPDPGDPAVFDQNRTIRPGARTARRSR